jgi:very-short-patch-repair endonuclease
MATPQARAKVEQARQAWIRKLIDVSRRNNLLFFRDLKKGTLDLSNADVSLRAALMRGESVAVKALLPTEDPERLGAVVAEITKRALANREERGLDTLYLGFGTASWPQEDGARPTDAPVLLVPVTATVKGIDRQTASLQRSGDVQINAVLLFALKTQCSVDLSAEELVAVVLGDDPDEKFDLGPLFLRIRQACAGVRDFKLSDRCVLGNFSFQKMAIVKDLEELRGSLGAHELIAAVAGDTTAAASIGAGSETVDPKSLDRVLPEQEFLVLDADSSQQGVIWNVLGGHHGLIQGPPGTGKSQTIANLIAELTARGKRILFVAEKRAALEVVLERLRNAGLGHLALDLHGAELSRRDVMAQIAESLRIIRDSVLPDVDPLHARFVQVRSRLLQHVEALHTPRKPSGLSVYQMQGQRLRIPHDATVRVRWRGAELQRLTGERSAEIQDLLTEAASAPELFLRDPETPWATAELTRPEQVQDAFDRVSRCLHDILPSLRDAVGHLCAATRLPIPVTTRGITELVSQVESVNALTTTYSRNLFLEDLEVLAGDLAPGAQLLSSLWASMARPGYRAARQRIRELAGRKVAAKVALADVREANRLKKTWTKSGGVVPRPIEAVEKARGLLTRLHQDLDAVRKVLPTTPGEDVPIEILEDALRALDSTRHTALALPRLREIEGTLLESGVGPLLAEMKGTPPPPPLWPAAFRYGWLESCLEEALLQIPELASFKGRAHDQIAEEFRLLDRQRIALACQRVRRAHAEHAIAAMNANAEQEAIVRRESEKRKRHRPLRRLVQEAGPVLTVLRPCWLASPLSVSQLLPATRDLFDIVLFDEASQVLPEDAIPSLYRANQGVVAGDRHQLPPTTFFAVTADEAAEEEASLDETAGFESLLDVMAGFCVPWNLDWHYRSRDEALIAFSNAHIYADRLVTFPGAHGGPAVLSHVHVSQPPGIEGQEDSVAAEAETVVQLVLEHAATRPKETLGVIAMGIKHADRIDAALYKALQTRPELQEFFDASRRERFFVKNLERVQGDERDAIILSIGYGKDRTGRLLYRFGPLLSKGGERRLNVAITRARSRLTLVSSFTHLDMEPGRSSATGVELLRLYLEYAASGGQRLGEGRITSVPLNEFEQDVFDTLSGLGMPLTPQWGTSHYRIDLAARHRHEPGRFVLAIECDGASYHSAPTARDRDRLRQQHLIALGWRFHRIWSTDWFLRKQEEVARAIAAYEEAMKRADGPREPDPPAAPKVDPPTTVVTLDPPAPTRTERYPPIVHKPNITDYSRHEIDAVIRWVMEDGRLRTDDELVDEARNALGFERRGKRIESAIREAIHRTRRT